MGSYGSSGFGGVGYGVSGRFEHVLMSVRHIYIYGNLGIGDSLTSDLALVDCRIGGAWSSAGSSSWSRGSVVVIVPVLLLGLLELLYGGVRIEYRLGDSGGRVVDNFLFGERMGERVRE